MFLTLALSTLATPRPANRSSAPGRDRSAELRGRLARRSLAAGVLVATLVELGGLRHLANAGGSGNPAELAELAGRMLVPAAVGVLGAVGACFSPPFVGRTPRHPSETAVRG